jgi:small subunit ribosomal protein S1
MSEETKQYQFNPGDFVDPDQLADEQEYSPEEITEFEDLIEKTLTDIKEGEVVLGKILRISKQDVAIDIGFKSEGIIPIEEFRHPEQLNIGDEVDVFLDSVDDGMGTVQLSHRKAEFMKIWERVVDAYENDKVIQGICARRIKGGMVVDIIGIDAFLPGSQIDVKAIRDFDSYIGKEMDFKIVKLNHARKNVVVSHRVLIEKDLEKQRAKILEGLEKGQEREGQVKNITDFGVFIDLGGVDGLLHITDLSWGRVNHPSEVVKLDQKLTVKVLDYNEKKDRISLGLKQLTAHPWENVAEKFPIGKVVDGRVVSITDYGAFVELDKGVEGLIHISEMSWSQHVKHPSQILSVGQECQVKILDIDSEDKKISLGIKQLEPDPWDRLEERYPNDSIHNGRVRNLTAFGAFVELEEGIDGLVHISDLSWTKKVRHPGEVVKKGDEIKVKILDINREERRIALGHKQIDPNPWDHFADLYGEGKIVEASVAKQVDKGVVVGLEMGVEGFVPQNHLLKGDGKKQVDLPAEGSTLKLKVIEFDKDNRRIVLSAKAVVNDEQKAMISGYKQDDSKTTIGDFANIEIKEDTKEQEQSAKEASEKAEAAAQADEQKKVGNESTAATAEADEEKKAPAKKTGKAKAEKDVAAAEVASTEEEPDAVKAEQNESKDSDKKDDAADAEAEETKEMKK